jgi:hypothetical protein
VSQRERRRNPYPWTWEPAATVVTVLGVVVVVGLQTGRTLANGLATGHWQVATPDTWAVTAPDLLAGDAAAGLEPRPHLVTSPAILWTLTALVEAVLLALTVLVLRWGWRRWSPWRPHGFASPADVDRVLGLPRLRRTAHLVRPDLHHQKKGKAA